MKKIAISGAHCTGKTTLVKALKESNQLNNYIFRSNLLRGLKEIGIPINEVGNTTTQLYVMTKFYEFLHTPGNAVLDRCALDGMAYTMFFYPEMTENMQSVFERMFEEMVFKYDAICYVVPELPLIDDGVRSVDKNFYDQVVQNFDILISEYQIPVHYISGSVETRTHQVLDIISNLETKN